MRHGSTLWPVLLARHPCTTRRTAVFSLSPDEPYMVFFSGGTALGAAAAVLMRKTHRTVHIVTPFDSGGSSAVLREAFSMPAVGDMRARLLALADRRQPSVEALARLLDLRFPKDGSEKALRGILYRMIRGRHPFVACLPQAWAGTVRRHLRALAEAMPAAMPLAGASLGNLVLTGGYLSAGRRFVPVLDELSGLLGARGLVRPVSTACAHLCAQLEDGSVVVGQHRITGKEHRPLGTPISRVWLADNRENPVPARVPADPQVCTMITRADLICYPMGSFYSSIVANLLPEGINTAVASTECPKVFVPNLGTDPELLGQTLSDQIAILAACMQHDVPIPLDRVLNTVLLDTRHDRYSGGVPGNWLAGEGVRLVTAPLVSERSAPYIDPIRLSAALLALCKA